MLANCLTTCTKVQERSARVPSNTQFEWWKHKSIKASGKSGPICRFRPHPLRCFVSKSACSLKTGGQRFVRPDNVLGATALTWEECWETTWHRETKLNIKRPRFEWRSPVWTQKTRQTTLTSTVNGNDTLCTPPVTSARVPKEKPWQWVIAGACMNGNTSFSRGGNYCNTNRAEGKLLT